MGKEIDLLSNYPKAKRDLSKRLEEKTEEDRRIARKFGPEFFDGERRHGYGGYEYNPRFWQPVIPTFQEHWSLDANSTLLDVGCGKGFMLHDLAALVPGITVKGIDISEYAIQNAIQDMQEYLQVGDAQNLPFVDDSFDIVISINTVHNLERSDCIKALQEIQRVSHKGSFITVDAYHTEAEKKAMMAWNLTALTVLHVDEWQELFTEAGYTGDYYWFIP